MRGVNRDTGNLAQVHTVQPSSPDHRILPPGVSWKAYESLLADMQDNHAAQFAYERIGGRHGSAEADFRDAFGSPKTTPQAATILTMCVVQRRFQPGRDTYADILDPRA